MYNKKLDTFLKVAELGSFSQAAEAMFISSSAVIQQINKLEKELGATLFVRSTHGLLLTEAGRFLQTEGQLFVQRSEDIRRHLRIVESRERNICVGTGLLPKCRLLYELWTRFCEGRSGYDINITSLGSLREISEQVELVEYLHDYEPWQREWEFLEICTVPVGCAVPRGHRLAQRSVLTYEDLQGETLVTYRGHSEELDRLYHDVLARGVSVVEMKAYDMSVFAKCIIDNCVLQTPFCWRDLHPELVAIRCDWEYSLPYGFFYRRNRSETVREFLDFVAIQREKEDFGARFR